MTFTLPFDFALLDWIQENMRSSFCDTFFSLITHLGDYGLFWIVFSLTLVAVPKTRKTGFFVVAALALNALLCNVCIKNIIDRTRPFAMEEFLRKYGEFKFLVSLPKDSSFPSGHTSVAFAIATALLLQRSRLSFVVVPLALLISFSRLYLYLHFPSDIAGGVVLGIMNGFLSFLLVNFIYSRTASRKSSKDEDHSSIS